MKPSIVVEEDCFPRLSRRIGKDREVLVLFEEECQSEFLAFGNLEAQVVHVEGLVFYPDEIAMEAFGPC